MMTKHTTTTRPSSINASLSLVAVATVMMLNLSHAQGQTAPTADNLTFGPKQEATGQRLDGVAVIVGNDVITYSEMAQLPDRTALEPLIVRKLLLQKAAAVNIQVGDTALNIAFDEQQKQGNDISRERLREDLMIQQLQQQVANSLVTISEQEIASQVERMLKSANHRVDLIDVLIALPRDASGEQLAATQAKVERLLAELNKDNSDPKALALEFGAIYNPLGWVNVSSLPTRFSKTLIDAPIGRFGTPMIDNDGIHLLKVVNRDTNQQANAGDSADALTETRVSHILIKTDGNPNAKAEIERIYQRLQAGEAFATLAKQYSQDTSSAVDGGALGWAYEGQMVPDFEAVMNQTAIGQISQPFQSKFGYHILTVHERRQASGDKGDAMAKKARKELFNKKASEEWIGWLKQLRDEARVEILAK